MVTSEDPLGRPQNVKHCQFCPGKDTKSVAEIVCNTCHVDLCRDCVGHRTISDPTIQHDVVTFELKKYEVTPLHDQCKQHEEKTSELFCKQCDSTVCLKCLVSGLHENHEVSKMLEIHSSRKQQIEWDTDELETSIAPVFKSILSGMEEMLSNVAPKHDDRQQAITEFGRRCHAVMQC
jgi:hypothetical protein